jgi:hypothetical protein
MALDAAAFLAEWRSVQADFLLPNGLVATRNVGNARNAGIEMVLRIPVAGFEVEGRAIAQRARLEGTRITSEEFDDRRLPIVPDFATSLQITHPIRLAGWRGTMLVAANAQGSTRLSFDPRLDQRTHGRATLRANVSLSNGPWSISLAGTNLTNVDSDAYAFGNPFLVRAFRERTPLQPLTLSFVTVRRF